MTPTSYTKIVEDSKKELEDLLIKQEDIERRISRLKQAILALTPLADEENALCGVDVEPMLQALGLSGITDALRDVLKAATAPMTPVEIKQRILTMGVDLSGHKNIMASIHSTLKRLAANDEVETRDNGLTYKWKWQSEALKKLFDFTRPSPDSLGFVPGSMTKKK
jgi:hypothetical protein